MIKHKNYNSKLAKLWVSLNYYTFPDSIDAAFLQNQRPSQSLYGYRHDLRECICTKFQTSIVLDFFKFLPILLSITRLTIFGLNSLPPARPLGYLRWLLMISKYILTQWNCLLFIGKLGSGQSQGDGAKVYFNDRRSRLHFRSSIKKF